MEVVIFTSHVVEGKPYFREEGGQVIIETPKGTIRLSRDDIAAIEALEKQKDWPKRDPEAPKITAVTVEQVRPSGKGAKVERTEIVFDRDEGPRADTTLEALAKLKPAFKQGGTVTAGNTSQMSDGAAALMVTSEDFAREHGLKPMARYVAYAPAALEPEMMGLGPIYAVPKVLKQSGLNLSDTDLIELNEAFAAQGLAVMRALDMDPEKTNVNGGAIALGHPLGATGAKLSVQALHELRRRRGRYAMVTMCVGGGMGAAGIFERLD